MFPSRRKVPTYAGFGSMVVTLPAAAFLGGAAYAQDYTGTPNHTINDTQTVYDGIGNVTPLPGGTSVLERVLYAIDQANTTSPGSVAPVNGVYANIAESVLKREWYGTDRTEIAFTDYIEDVTTTETQSLTWSSISSPAPESDFSSTSTIVDPDDPTNSSTVADMEFMKISVFAGNTNNMGSVTYSGTNTYTFSEYESLTAAGSIDLPTPYDPAGADVRLLPNGDLSFTGGSQGFLILVVEVAGQSYLFDTIGNSGDYTAMTVINAAGYPYELDQLGSVPYVSGSTINLSSDLTGTSTSATYPFSTTIADTSLGSGLTTRT